MVVASWFLRQKKSRAGNSQKKTKKTGMNIHNTAQMIIALWFLRKEKKHRSRNLSKKLHGIAL